VKEKFDLVPNWIIADTAYGSGPMLGWLVDRKIDGVDAPSHNGIAMCQTGFVGSQ
jgi:hypothetical protein